MSKKALAAILLIAGIAIPMSLVPFEDFRFGDEPYQAYCCQNYARAYLGMLTFWAGNLWMKIFGEYFVALRVLMTLCYLSSIAAGCLYVRHKGYSLIQTAAIFFIGAVGIILNNITVYGWDAASYPFVALCVYTTLLYLEHPSPAKSATIGALLALMTLTRFPLIVSCAIVGCVILYRQLPGNGCRKALTDIVLTASAMVVTFCVMTTVMVGSPINYFTAISGENTVGGHTLGYVFEIWKMCKEFAFLIAMVLLPGCVVVALSYFYARQHSNNIVMHIFSLALIIYSVKSAFVLMPNPRDQMFWCNFGIIIPISFFIICYGPLKRYIAGESQKPAIIYLLTIFAFAMSQAAGSDRIVERIGWVLAMPFAFGANKDIFLKDRKLTYYLIGFTVIMLTGFYGLKMNTLRHQWGEPVYPNYATVFKGIRPHTERDMPFEALDSIKFLKDNVEALGLRTIAIGTSSNCFNFPVGENGENSGLRFYVTDDAVKEDFLRADRKKRVDAVIGLTVGKDSELDDFMSSHNFAPYQRTFFPLMTVFVRDSILPTLPTDPFQTWNYQK